MCTWLMGARMERASESFGGESNAQQAPVDAKPLHAKIGELTLENDFFESARRCPN